MRRLTTRNWSLTGGKPTTVCQRDWHTWRQTDPTSQFACKDCSRAVGKAARADITPFETYRRILIPHATCRLGVSAAERREHRDDRWTLRCFRSWLPENEALCVGQHTLATWSSTQKVVSLSMVRCASEAIGLADTVRELGHKAHVRIWTDAAAARRLALRSGNRAIKHMETK